MTNRDRTVEKKCNMLETILDYVRSKKSAKRVAESIIQYIEEELKLKVNREKTRIGKASESSLLGYSFYNDKGTLATSIK